MDRNDGDQGRNPDLKAVLWDVSKGAEPRLPGRVRREWQRDHDVPENIQ